MPRITSDLDKLDSKLKQFSEEAPEAFADQTGMFPTGRRPCHRQAIKKAQREGKKGKWKNTEILATAVKGNWFCSVSALRANTEKK